MRSKEHLRVSQGAFTLSGQRLHAHHQTMKLPDPLGGARYVDLRTPAQKCHRDRCRHGTPAVPEPVVDSERLTEARVRFGSHRRNGKRWKYVVQPLTAGDPAQEVDMLPSPNPLQQPDPDAGN